jgi:hypothetical protein
LSAISIHLLAGAVLVFVNLMDDKSRVTENYEPFDAELNSDMEVV